MNRIVMAIGAWLLLLMCLGFARTALGQYLDPYSPRPVAQFALGDEEHCIHHWHEDLNILRIWQQEYAYWRGAYNQCAESLGLGPDYWPSNPTLDVYKVSPSIIQDDFTEGKYRTLTASCNAHIKAGHATEDQFARETYQLHINYCHCRATTGIGVCDAAFPVQFGYRFVGK